MKIAARITRSMVLGLTVSGIALVAALTFGLTAGGQTSQPATTSAQKSKTASSSKASATKKTASKTGSSKSSSAAAKSHSTTQTASSTKTTTAKGKTTRVPRTLRTIPVSKAVREKAVMRVEASLFDSASSPFLYPAALQQFFRALSEEQAERSTGGANSERTVRILQFGDSHTAADIFTGEMRANLQQQFGDGGLGFQFPGHPFAGYHLAGSLRSQTTGWFTEGNRFTALGDGDLGMGGISISTEKAGQTITLEIPCTTLQLHYLQQAAGGRLQFSDNGTPLSVIDTGAGTVTAGVVTASAVIAGAMGESAPPAATDAAAVAGTAGTGTAGTFTYACGAGLHEFAFTTLDEAPVKLLGLVTEQPGVTYECLGINGAVAPLMLRWNQTLFDDYMRQRSPNLIVLAYGTNEAGVSAEHLESYPEEFATILDNLHRIAPAASILVLGPADRSMRAGRGGPWRPFIGTDRIIAMQKEACRTHGCTFWDTRRRMGGFGAMQVWVAAGWAQPDRTHLTGTGYRSLADALYADLMHAYNLYQQHPEVPIRQTSLHPAAGHQSSNRGVPAYTAIAQESSNG